MNIFQFLEVNLSIYLNRRVFVLMCMKTAYPSEVPEIAPSAPVSVMGVPPLSTVSSAALISNPFAPVNKARNDNDPALSYRGQVTLSKIDEICQ